MRCTLCGLPLSPVNTPRECPRCSMPVVAGSNTGGKLKRVPMAQAPAWGDGTTPTDWQNGGVVAGNSQPGMPPENVFPVSQHTPYSQPGQMWRPLATPPTTPATPAPAGGVEGLTFSAREIPEISQPYLEAQDMQRGTRPLRPIPVMHKGRGVPVTGSNVGFIIAALCVTTGGLLLILVYFLSAGISAPVVQTQGITAGNAITTTTRHHTATAGPTHREHPSPTATSGAYPAQQYITNPQMASEVNTDTAQVIQVASTFKVGQRVYVTFSIHPNGGSGAVCLQWYLNTQVVSHYEFAVSASSTVAYSYTYYAGTGAAYVQIYWASSVSCSDELLAQRVNFAVVS